MKILVSNGRFDPSFRRDKPGVHCLGSSKDGEWDVFVDMKPSNIKYTPHECYLESIADSPHPDSSQCFLWNHRLRLKVQIARFLFRTNSFMKCFVSCNITPIVAGKKEICLYKVYFFYSSHPAYMWCSHRTPKWQGRQYFDPATCWVYSDVVLYKPNDRVGITMLGMLCRGNMRMQAPNYSLHYQRRLVIHGDRLLLIQRKVFYTWEVWEVDFQNRTCVRVYNLEGVVVFINRLQMAAYSRPGFKGNCICFTEYEKDVENFYVLWLDDLTVSVYKNQPHSGFPAWFPNLASPGLPWLSLTKEDGVKKPIIEELDERGNEIPPFGSHEICGLANRFHELPCDLKSTIAQAFHSTKDYTNFRLVCKDWQKIAPPIQWKPSISGSTLEFPWLMLCHEEKPCISILDPHCNMKFYYNNEELSRCKIRYSKDGWLLVTQGVRIFFLEPFSKTIIHLPNLPENYKIDAMSFSSSPECSDWIIISVLSPLFTNRVMYLRSIDKQWNVIDCPIGQQRTFFFACGGSPVFHNRAFYYLDFRGNLATFWWDMETQAVESRIINMGGSIEQLSNCSKGYLISCEDDLFLVVVGSFGKFASTYKFDVESSEWKRTKMMKNYSFFVCPTSSFAVAVTEETRQRAIYVPLLVDNRFLFYKSDASEFGCLDDANSSRSNSRRGFYERKELHYGIWIQPKVIRGYK